MARNPLGGLLKRRQHNEGKAVMPFGERTPEQREAALEAAREARAAQARLLADVRNGSLSLAEIFSDDYSGIHRVQRVPVRTLLKALPGVGSVTVDHAMDAIGIAEKRRVGGLGERQKHELLERFAK